MVNSIPNFTFSDNCHVSISRAGDISLSIQGTQYRGKIESDHTMHRSERKKIKGFIYDIFKNYSLDPNRGSLQDLKIGCNSQTVKVFISQKDVVTKDLNQDTIQIKKSSDIPFIHLSKVKQTSLIKRIMKLVKPVIRWFTGKNTPISRKVIGEFRQLLGKIPLSFQKSIFRELSEISKSERELFEYLDSHIDFTKCDRTTVMLEILKGAYCMFDDDAKAYNKFAGLDGAEARISSHESDDVQFAICGSFIKTSLFSRKKIKDSEGNLRPVSWMQLERYPLTLKLAVAHWSAYIIYKLIKQNIGPYGTSIYKEDNPLILPLLSKKNPPSECVIL